MTTVSRSSRHAKRHCLSHSKSEGSRTFLRARSSEAWCGWGWVGGRAGGRVHALSGCSSKAVERQTRGALQTHWPGTSRPATSRAPGCIPPLQPSTTPTPGPLRRTHLLLVHVHGDAGLQVGALDARQVGAQRDVHQLAQHRVRLLGRARHRRLICLGGVQRGLAGAGQGWRGGGSRGETGGQQCSVTC